MTNSDLRAGKQKFKQDRYFLIMIAGLCVVLFSAAGTLGAWALYAQSISDSAHASASGITGVPLFSALLIFGILSAGQIMMIFVLGRFFHRRQVRQVTASLCELAESKGRKTEVFENAFSHHPLYHSVGEQIQKLQSQIHHQNHRLEQMDRKQSTHDQRQQAVEGKLEKYQKCLNMSPEALYWIRQDGSFAEVNQTACKMLEYSQQELLSMRVFDIDPEFPAEIWPQHWQEIKEKGRDEFHSHHRRSNGTILSIEVNANYLEADGHEYICGFVRDISQDEQEQSQRLEDTYLIQRQQELLLKVCKLPSFSQGDLQAVAKVITEQAAHLLNVERASVWLLNDDGSLLTCEDLFTRQEKQHASDFWLNASDYPAYFKALEVSRVIDASDAWRDLRTREFLESYLRPQGIVSMLDGVIRVSGKTAGVICCESVEDPRMWNECEMRFVAELADQLSQVLVQRNRYQAEEQAHALANKACKSSRSKSEFLASISHEIRTPMNAIIGFADLLADEELNEEQSNYVNIIQTSGANMLALINDILDFSKIEAGRMTVEMVDTSLAELLEDVDSILRPAAEQKGLEFGVLQCQEVPKKITTDPVRLRQCLVNLVNNAIKFTHHGHVYLNVSMLDRGNEQCIQFDVEDTGIGIQPENLDHVFEAFKQAETSTTRKFGGTGLGLAITQKLAELLGGRVEVSSTPDKGSVFTLLIPAGKGVLKNPEDSYNKYDRAQEARELPAETKPGRSGHILVVEDNPANQALISLLLKKMGLKVTMAGDGVEGVEAVAENNFDLILMDMQMPRMNGYEATQELRDRKCSLPIIAITANAMKGDREKCLEAGCDDYLSKPVDRKKLKALLDQYLKTEKASSQGEGTQIKE